MFGACPGLVKNKSILVDLDGKTESDGTWGTIQVAAGKKRKIKCLEKNKYKKKFQHIWSRFACRETGYRGSQRIV